MSLFWDGVEKGEAVMPHYRSRRIMALTLVAIATPAGTSAIAQDLAVEEIVVTARKRAESLLDIPVAVTAFSAAQLEGMGVRDMADIADFTPGLFLPEQNTMRNDRGNNIFIFRSINPVTGQATRQPGSAFLDGTYLSNGAISGLTDIERVEIIKGPQNAQFGRSTFSGAINYVTRVPGSDWKGRVNVEAARFGTTDLNVSLEGPLANDTLAFRFSARQYNTDGQYRNFLNTSEKFGARETESGAITLYATPSDNFNAKAYATLWRDDDGPGAQVIFGPENRKFNTCPAGVTVIPWICGKLPKAEPSDIAQNTVLTPTLQRVFLQNGGRFTLIYNPAFIEGYGLERHAWHAHVSMEYTIPSWGVTLTSLTGADQDHDQKISDQDSRDSSVARNPLAFLPNATPTVDWAFLLEQFNENFSQEFRAASEEDRRLRWSIGVNYFAFENRNTVSSVGPFGFLQFGSLTRQKVKTFGVFGAASYDVTERISLNLEARKQWDKVRDRSAPTAPEFKDTFESFAPRVIVDFKPTDGATLYATYARGFRPGAFNSTIATLSQAEQAEVRRQTGAELAVPEEKLDNFEAGFKGRFFDGRATFNSAVYMMEWLNQHQAQLATLVNPANPAQPRAFGVTTALGKTDLWGAEVEGSFAMTEALTLFGSFNIADSEIKVFNCGECTTVVGNANGAIGKRIGRTPKYSGTATVTYRDRLAGNYDWTLRADYIYSGSKFESFMNLARTGPAHRVNLRLGAETEELRVETFVTNLFDEDTYSSIQTDANLLDTTFRTRAIGASLPDRRSWGVRASYEF